MQLYKMIVLLIALLVNAMNLVAMDVVSNRYCPDMKPQNYVTIEQLMGMWYGVEIISHKQHEERFGVRQTNTCPIIHISEDNSPTTPPFYVGQPNYPSNYPYNINYDTDYDNTQRPRTDYNYNNNYNPDPYLTNYGQQGQRYPYEQNSQYGQNIPYVRPPYTGNEQGRQLVDEYQRRYAEDIKRLTLLWDENGSYVEYFLRYNTSKPGFWISSGPNNGSSLEQQYNRFAGTVQVIKAVGNHLALTFCRQLPDQQLYTALLSRVPMLARLEIGDVRDLLKKRGLETFNIKKVCAQNHSNQVTWNIFLLLPVIISVFVFTS